MPGHPLQFGEQIESVVGSSEAPSSLTACDHLARRLRLVCDRVKRQPPIRKVIAWKAYQIFSWQLRVGILPRFARDARNERQRCAPQEKDPLPALMAHSHVRSESPGSDPHAAHRALVHNQTSSELLPTQTHMLTRSHHGHSVTLPGRLVEPAPRRALYAEGTAQGAKSCPGGEP